MKPQPFFLKLAGRDWFNLNDRIKQRHKMNTLLQSLRIAEKLWWHRKWRGVGGREGEVRMKQKNLIFGVLFFNTLT